MSSPYKSLLLAESYEEKSAYRRALSIYQSLIKTEDISLRVKINIGNVHFKLEKYDLAIQFYKKALDQVGQNKKLTYTMIMNNIGLALVKQEHFSEADFVFAYIAKENPNTKAYIHLILCAYALQSVSKICRCFVNMFTLPELNQIEQIERIVFLIAPVIEKDGNEGFQWCLDVIRITDHAWIADNLEVSRIVNLTRCKRQEEALKYLATLKVNTEYLTDNSKINLSFIDLQLKRYRQVEKLLQGCTSPKAYNNFGVLKMLQGDFPASRMAFQNAFTSNADFYELFYNLVLLEKKSGNVKRAEKVLHVLMKKFPSNPMIKWQEMCLTECQKLPLDNLEVNLQLCRLNCVADPKILRRVSELYGELSNFTMSEWYFQEAYSVSPIKSQ